MCSFQQIQKRIFDSRFARFRDRNTGTRNPSIESVTLVTFPAKSVTASQEMMCYLLFDELCDDTMKNLVIGYSNSGVGAECINRGRSEFRLNLCRGI